MIIKLFRSIISYFLVGLILIFIGIPCLLLSLLPARWRYDNKLFFWLSDIFYKLVLKATMLPIKIVGKENIPKGPAIIVANHQSALDIPLIGSIVDGYPHIWLAISYLANSWIGPIVRRMTVLIDMSTPQKGMRSLVEAIKLIGGNGRHAIIFPEGGRYADGNDVREFFSGFAMIAKKTNRPVVPVMIFDAYKVYPPGVFFINSHPIKVVIGKPFFMKEGEEVNEFKNRVHKWFVKQAGGSEL